MRTFQLTLLLLLLNFQSVAQFKVNGINADDTLKPFRFYRGRNNIISLLDTSYNLNVYSLKNDSITTVKEKNQISVLPGNLDSVFLVIQTFKTENLDTNYFSSDTVICKIIYTPRPEIFIGNSRNGQTLDTSSVIIECRYPEQYDDLTKTKFNVRQYSVKISGIENPINGTGSTYSTQLVNTLNQLGSNTKIEVSVIYCGNYHKVISATFYTP
ncbi:MAG: hypothetical protein RLZ33_3177 [Bacteroidota bacterium]|jgi:hypothetical protein